MIDMKEIEDFLKSWLRDFNDCEERPSYFRYKYIEETNDEIGFEEELEKLLEKLNIVYTYTFVGGIDSPGYDLSCNCLSIINKEGKLISYPIPFEIY